MTYYERNYQLNKTLESFKNSHQKDIEVIVVDDDSKKEKGIHLSEFPFPVSVIKITKEKKKWTNPEPAYNIGIAQALKLNPDVLIIQNAENYHVGDVISYATTVTDSLYYAYSCFSLDKENTFKEHNIEELIRANDHRINASGQLGWYNHPRYRPNAYDFCVAVTPNNIKLLNGYDERFSNGYAMGDANLIFRVKSRLKLQVYIPLYPFVVHQWHYDFELPEHALQLYERNKTLYFKLKNEMTFKATHIYTDDL